MFAFNVKAAIDGGICCPSPIYTADNCGRSNCIQQCSYPKPSILELADDNTKYQKHKGFFLETRGDQVLNIRQACSVESLALHNPNLIVYVLFTGGKINSSATVVQTLREKYDNVRMIEVNLDEYLSGMPLEHWYHCTDWRNGSYHVSHLSDGLRFLTLAKFGVYYFDLDVVLVRPLTDYRNFVSMESGYSMSSAALHSDYGHPFMQMAAEEFPRNYK